MTASKRAFGTEGEELCSVFLKKKKRMKTLQKNYTVKGGEIDLVLMDKKTIVFCEVKTRSYLSKELGSAQLAVDKIKQKRIKHASKVFLLKEGENYKFNDYRFDVVEVYIPEDPKKVFVRHTPNAFI